MVDIPRLQIGVAVSTAVSIVVSNCAVITVVSEIVSSVAVFKTVETAVVAAIVIWIDPVKLLMVATLGAIASEAVVIAVATVVSKVAAAVITVVMAEVLVKSTTVMDNAIASDTAETAVVALVDPAATSTAFSRVDRARLILITAAAVPVPVVSALASAT